MEKGDRIVQLIIEKINNQELPEVVELDDSKRGTQGFGHSNSKAMSAKPQGGNDQSVKPRIQISEILALAFGQFYRREDGVDILKWDEVDNDIQLEAINISTELAIKKKKKNEDLGTNEIVRKEYHHMLDVFEKRKKRQYPHTGQELT